MIQMKQFKRGRETKLKSTQPHSAKAGATVLTNDVLVFIFSRFSWCFELQSSKIVCIYLCWVARNAHGKKMAKHAIMFISACRNSSIDSHLNILATYSHKRTKSFEVKNVPIKKLVAHCLRWFSSSVSWSLFHANPGSDTNVIQFSYFLFVSRATNNEAPAES